MNDRVHRALTDVVAVEREAPGMVTVVTWSDAYTVDARDGGCMCPDKEYHDVPMCKHEYAALFATSDLPAPWDVTESLANRPDTDTTTEPKAMTDGGQLQQDGEWIVFDPENDNARTFESRAEAEDARDDMAGLGVDVELYPPGESPGADTDDAPDPEPDGGNPEEAPEVVDVQPGPATAKPPEDAANDLPERSIAEDPLNWVPGDFVDEIDGTQAINRKGFEVLAHFYDVDVYADLEVAPEETDFEYARVKARAVTADGRECESYGSAHVDRGDDHDLLLEMADTRARKRALSIATGVGAVAVAELKSEVDA